jgi:hypothetical protein
MLARFKEIVDANKNLTFETNDKIAYINVYFALHYHMHDRIMLNKALVQTFCKDLILLVIYHSHSNTVAATKARVIRAISIPNITKKITIF